MDDAVFHDPASYAQGASLMDPERFESQLRRNADLIQPWLRYVGWMGAGALVVIVAATRIRTGSWDLVVENLGALLLTVMLMALVQSFMRFQLHTIALLRKHGILPPGKTAAE